MAWLGMITLSVFLILTSWFNMDNAWPFIWVGLLAHIIGLILIGLANWRARRLAPLHILPLAVGLLAVLLPFALGFVAGESNWPLWLLGYSLGLGWMIMGFLLLTARGVENQHVVDEEPPHFPSPLN